MAEQHTLLLLGEGPELSRKQLEAREVVPLGCIDVLFQLLVACNEIILDWLATTSEVAVAARASNSDDRSRDWSNNACMAALSSVNCRVSLWASSMTAWRTSATGA